VGLSFIQSLFVDPLRADRSVVRLPMPFTAHPRQDDNKQDKHNPDDDTDSDGPGHALIVVDRSPGRNDLEA
jgi:hypothetical protein